MAGDHDDAVFGSGKLGDDVVDGKLAFGVSAVKVSFSTSSPLRWARM